MLYNADFGSYSGRSGIASTFSWIDPLRPYLMGLTVLVLGFAWYQQLKPKKEFACECETYEKSTFFKSKTFLGFVTVFAMIMLAFPYYSGIFYRSTEKKLMIVNKSDITITEFKISGMTCESCEEHINYVVNKLDGILMSKTSYQYGNSIIEFDKTKTTETEIEKVIKATGYKVTTNKES